MNIWLYKRNGFTATDKLTLVDVVEQNDKIYVYSDDNDTGTFLLSHELLVNENRDLINDESFKVKKIDLPYTVLYKTKTEDSMTKLTSKEIKFVLDIDTNEEVDTQNTDEIVLSDKFISFIKRINPNIDNIQFNNVDENIIFNIGQPNTGKSYKFEESQIFNKSDLNKYQYLKIPVSGGIGNEYKGLQNTDLAITYDPIKEELKFGEFLQILMSAIVNPSIPHVIFLDDFHNQDISSLLSEYTPLFKAQQKSKIKEPIISNSIYNPIFASVDCFIQEWNDFIKKHCEDTPMVPLTNRISGHSLNLVYPDNFYLLGAANFNANTLNIFADWEDRAKINYINPIDSFKYQETVEYAEEEQKEKDFLTCCIDLNKSLKDILKDDNKIFDYEKYCFGLWKVVYKEDQKTKLINNIVRQIEVVNFFLSMIKNALKFNNKNSEINAIGWKLIIYMQTKNKWFKEHVENENLTIDNIQPEILHKHNIYEDEI